MLQAAFYWRPPMQMPIFSYFLVVGTILFGILVLVSNQLEPKPLRVSQRLGLPARFKAPPEQMQTSNDAVNFAAEYSVRNDQISNAASKQKRTNNPS
jgi:hypothetical protein